MAALYLISLLISAVLIVQIWKITSDKYTTSEYPKLHKVFSLICFIITAINMVVQEPILLIFAVLIFIEWIGLTS